MTRLEVRSYSNEALRHAHGYHQLVLPLEGSLEMEIGGLEGQVDALHAAVIPAGTPHSYAASSANAFLVADLSFDRRTTWGAGPAIWREAQRHPFVAFDADISAYCRFIKAEVARFGTSRVDVETHMALLVQTVARRMAIPETPEQRILLSAQHFIDDNLHRDFDVAEIARAAGTSPSRLHRVFRTALGGSPQRYASEQRLTLASRLLRRRELSLAEIAFRSGYADQATFTRAFKRQFGQAPGAFRRAQAPD